MVEQWLPTLDLNTAQDDAEVLDLLLKQLGYRPSLSEEVQAAWLGGIRKWRAKKAVDEKHLSALRACPELTQRPYHSPLHACTLFSPPRVHGRCVMLQVRTSRWGRSKTRT